MNKIVFKLSRLTRVSSKKSHRESRRQKIS